MIVNPKGLLIITLRMEFRFSRRGMLVRTWEKITSRRFDLRT